MFSCQIAWRYAKLRKNGRPAIDALICYTNHHAAFRFAKRIRRDLTKASTSMSGFVGIRSEEHTSELQSLMRISYAVFCLTKKQHTRRLNLNEYATLMKT